MMRWGTYDDIVWFLSLEKIRLSELVASGPTTSGLAVVPARYSVALQVTSQRKLINSEGHSHFIVKVVMGRIKKGCPRAYDTRKTRMLNTPEGMTTSYQPYHFCLIKPLASEWGKVRIEVLLRLWNTRIIGHSGIDSSTTVVDLGATAENIHVNGSGGNGELNSHHCSTAVTRARARTSATILKHLSRGRVLWKVRTHPTHIGSLHPSRVK